MRVFCPMMPVISDGLVVGLSFGFNCWIQPKCRASPIGCNLTPKTRVVCFGKWKQHFLSNMDRIYSGNFGRLNGVWSNEIMFKPTQIYNEIINKLGPQRFDDWKICHTVQWSQILKSHSYSEEFSFEISKWMNLGNILGS